MSSHPRHHLLQRTGLSARSEMRPGCTVIATTVVALVTFITGVGSIQAADTLSSGSGVVIGTHGEVLTNAHVVEDCTQITIRSSPGASAAAQSVAHDEKNDLAVVRSNAPISSVASFRDGAPVRAGDAVVALGYPLSGLLAKTANLSVGNVSALAGLGNDTRYLQISAPVQPGNSGGPLLDASGNIVGIVTAKLNAMSVARFTGDIPQNVNFALKAEVARTFLDSNGIAYQTARSEQKLSPADVGDVARPFTVYIECKKASSQIATPSNRPLPTPKPQPTPTPPAVQVVFPSGISAKYSNEPSGEARMHTCLDQYIANKANNANGGLKWIQQGGGYYTECNIRLKGG